MTTITTRPTHRFSAATLAAALFAAAVAAPAVRADRIDGELINQTTSLVDHIKANHAKRVAVLKFRASRDGSRPDFHLGPINNVMADRLENTLVLGYKVDPDCTLDVLHNATAVASAEGLSYLPAEKAGKLFDLKYPRVVTGELVSPDLFLTGEIQFDTNKHTTTVVIQSLTREHPELREVTRFTVPTERSTVAESGRSFVINRSLAERDPGPDKDEAKDTAKDTAGAAADKAAQEQVAKATQQQTAKAGPDREQPATKPPAETSTTQAVRPVSTPDRYVDLRVLYNDEDVQLETDARDGNQAFARDPKEGDTVKFLLVNRSPTRVAVALLVNGFNTVKEELWEPLDCTKWILDPKQNLVVDGFYTGATGRNNVKPFRVLSNRESDAWLEKNTGDLRNERLGTICLHVFVEGTNPATSDVAVTRGLSPAQLKKETGKIKSMDDLTKALYAAADKGKRDRMLNRGLIHHDDKTQDGSKLIEEPFKNATEVQHLLIHYYDRKQK
jgi:hypothetical protein